MLAPQVDGSPAEGTLLSEDAPDTDPREELTDWITAPENPFFAQVIVNRIWADLMGRATAGMPLTETF